MALKLLLLLIVFCNSVYSEKVFLNKHEVSQKQDIVILDVRDAFSFHDEHIKGSFHIDVNALNDNKSIQSSMLANKAALQDALQKNGLNKTKHYLILGLGIHKWGEDGRLFWILNNLTTTNVYLYDGGFKRYVSDFNINLVKGSTNPSRGNVSLNRDWFPLTFEKVKEFQGIIIDVRTTAEFLGATPFGSAKGGRIAQSISIPWSDFFTPMGLVNIKNKSRILDKIRGQKNILVYCTAGYRSALIYAVLKDWGVTTSNYDGSWFEYSIRSKS